MPDHNQGIINYGSIGRDATVHNTTTYVGEKDAGAREELKSLLTQLQNILSQLPAEHQDTAQAVAAQASLIASTVRADKPNRTLLETAGQALKAAATGLLSVAPNVLSVTEGIIHVVQSLTGK